MTYSRKQTIYRFSSRVLLLISAAAIVLNAAGVSRLSAEDKSTGRIEPYAKNPRYWQYEGRPVMLLGGSINFQDSSIPRTFGRLPITGGPWSVAKLLTSSYIGHRDP